MSGYIGATVVGLETTAADVTGDITATDDSPELTLKNSTHEDTDGGREGKITFKGEQSGGEESTLAQIQASHDGTSDDQKGDLIFKTNDGSDGASPTERMRIDSAGDVGIGTAPTYGRLHIFDDNSDIAMDANGSGQLHIDGNGYGFGVALNASGAQLYTNSASRDIIFGTNETERMRITDGKVGIGDTAPDRHLHVNGGTENVVAKFESTDTACSVEFTDSTGTVTLETRNDFRFKTGSNIDMMINSSGNVGIGETVPNADLVVKQSGSTFTPSGNTVALFQRNTATGSGCMVSILSGNNSAADLNFADAQDEDVGRIRYSHSDNSMQFQTNANERMRIDSNGNVLVGKTSGSSDYFLHLGGTSSKGSIKFENAYSSQTVCLVNNTSNANFNPFIFQQAGTNKGNILVTTTGTSYITSSDYRLKENVVELTGATDRLKQLEPRRFNFIADADTTVDGFLAHEAATVVPEAVTGAKDAMRDEEYQVSAATGDIYTPATEEAEEVIHSSNVEQPETLEEGQQWRETTAAVMGIRSVPDYQGIDQSKLVPLLTAALQEAIAKIETLETKVAALEGA